MPIVTIRQSPRSREMKQALVERVTAAFVEVYGLAPDSVQIFFDEFSPDCWAKGGRLNPRNEPEPG